MEKERQAQTLHALTHLTLPRASGGRLTDFLILQMRRLRAREVTQLVNCRGRTGVQIFLASQQATSLTLGCALSIFHLNTRLTDPKGVASGKPGPASRRPRGRTQEPTGWAQQNTRGSGHDLERLPVPQSPLHEVCRTPGTGT